MALLNAEMIRLDKESFTGIYQRYQSGSYPSAISGLGVPYDTVHNVIFEKYNNFSHKSHDHLSSLQTLYGGWKKTFVNKRATAAPISSLLHSVLVFWTQWSKFISLKSWK